MIRPTCPHCGEERGVEHVARETWFCTTCGKTFPAPKAGDQKEK